MKSTRQLFALIWLGWSSLVLAGVDINTATLEELDSLKGVGPKKAQAIIDYRKQNGPFRSADDLRRVPGFGPKVVDGFIGDVTFGRSVGGGAGQADAVRPARTRISGATLPAAEPAAPAQPKTTLGTRPLPPGPAMPPPLESRARPEVATAPAMSAPEKPARPAMPAQPKAISQPAAVPALPPVAPAQPPATSASASPKPAAPAMPRPAAPAADERGLPASRASAPAPAAPARPAMPAPAKPAQPAAPAAPAHPAARHDDAPAHAPAAAQPPAPAKPRPAMPAGLH